MLTDQDNEHLHRGDVLPRGQRVPTGVLPARARFGARRGWRERWGRASSRSTTPSQKVRVDRWSLNSGAKKNFATHPEAPRKVRRDATSSLPMDGESHGSTLDGVVMRKFPQAAAALIPDFSSLSLTTESAPATSAPAQPTATSQGPPASCATSNYRETDHSPASSRVTSPEPHGYALPSSSSTSTTTQLLRSKPPWERTAGWRRRLSTESERGIRGDGGIEKSPRGAGMGLRRDKLGGRFPSVSNLVAFAGAAASAAEPADAPDRPDGSGVATWGRTLSAERIPGLRKSRSLHEDMNVAAFDKGSTATTSPWQRFAEWRALNKEASRAECKSYIERAISGGGGGGGE
jgi:hypothetical protein